MYTHLESDKHMTSIALRRKRKPRFPTPLLTRNEIIMAFLSGFLSSPKSSTLPYIFTNNALLVTILIWISGIGVYFTLDATKNYTIRELEKSKKLEVISSGVIYDLVITCIGYSFYLMVVFAIVYIMAGYNSPVYPKPNITVPLIILLSVKGMIRWMSTMLRR
jgi:hypothetical protein